MVRIYDVNLKTSNIHSTRVVVFP